MLAALKSPSMKRTATSRSARKQQERQRRPAVSRLHRPADMTIEAWQRQLRKQFGSEQPFLIENVGGHPVFSEFRVTNPARGSVHRVAIRGAEPGRNFCSCADFKTNALGTCKHIEFTLATLLAKRGAKRAFLAGYEPPYSSVSVEAPRGPCSFGRAATVPSRCGAWPSAISTTPAV
jgi:hypothetical protein